MKRVRAFMESTVAPVVTQYRVDDAFSFGLLPALKELGIGGLGMQDYGCAGGSVASLGFVQMEIGTHRPLVRDVHWPAQRPVDGRHLSRRIGRAEAEMATADGAVGRIGCFGLIEPLVGSGVSGAMLNTAKREGDIWTLKGEKRWIGNASLCDVSVIWARALADDQVKGFIVENKTTPGFSVEKLEHKIRLKIARVLLGGKGIVAGHKVARCFADCGALYSYEGTYQMQNLILGKVVTGLSAFI